MSGDLRRIAPLACVLLVTLRMSVGWHLLYEGWWKINTQSTPTPWSAEGYLKNATGPLRNTFRGLTGDPADFGWLDQDAMTKKWTDWRNRFASHYGDEEATSRLDVLLDGPAQFAVKLEELPEGVTPEAFPKGVKFDAGKKQLICDGKLHLLPAERDSLQKLVKDKTDASAKKFQAAVDNLFKAASKLSYKERLTVLLSADPDRVGTVFKEKGEVVESRMGDIELYKKQVERYDANYAKAKTSYQFDHLDRQYRDLMDLKRRVLGPIQALDKDLKTEAEKLLSEESLARGPVPEPWTEIRKINWRTMWGLATFGFLLIIGLFTRLAALGGAALLLLFYLAAPPWPGVPEIPGPEHNYIVNKVYLECLTCLVLASLPSGQWFGVDALTSGWSWKKKVAK